MDPFYSWGNVVMGSFYGLWEKSVGVLPRFLGAIVVFIFGLFVSEAVGRLVAKALSQLYLDRAAEKTGTKTILEKVGFKLQLSKALGLLVTWFLYLVFLIAVADILGLPQITEFLKSVVLYVPNVIVAVVILVAGMLVANLVSKLVKEVGTARKIPNVKVVAAVAQWSILIFSMMAALVHLQVAADLVKIFFSGLVFMLSLAGGLAFGLGGKEKAAEILRKCCRNGKNTNGR